MCLFLVMLKNSSNENFKALSKVRTVRRLALTGSPIQNNLLEYFRMVSWCRPGLLGTSETEFDAQYADPIMRGMASDATPEIKQRYVNQSALLRQTLNPYVHRKDSSLLADEVSILPLFVYISLFKNLCPSSTVSYSSCFSLLSLLITISFIFYLCP